MDRDFRKGECRAKDGTKLKYYTWFADRAFPLMLIAHGFGEHAVRYQPFVERIAGLPINIAAFDMRGHGASDGPKAYVPKFEQFAEDIEVVRGHLADQYPLVHQPFILFGHSMGAEAALLYALSHQIELKALILSSPCIMPNLWFPGASLLVWLIKTLFPRALVNKPVIPDRLTHDAAEQARYLKDDLIIKCITPNLAWEMIRAGRDIQRRAPELKVATHMLVSGDDHIVKKNATRLVYDRLGSQTKNWLEFDGFYHEIFREREREKVFKALESILQIFLED